MTSNAISRKKIKLKKTGEASPNDIVVNPIKVPKGGIKLKRTSLTRGEGKRRSSVQKKESIYGLDVEFLRQIGKEDVIQVILIMLYHHI